MTDAVCPPALPGAMTRLGSDLFIPMSAFPLAPQSVRLVYFRRDLLEKALGRRLANDAEAREFIEGNLLLTLDAQRAQPGSTPVTVYADRQADPMNMSLNGNQGSGRAAYVGGCFNLKGLGKTALATSVDPNHSNGRLDLVSGLWEMICSNVLDQNLRTGTAPVVAVIDLQSLMRVPWREPEVPSGLIVRLDLRGELDRPTHMFQRQQPVSANQLRQIAAALGAQDAEKFIERILHGCWSAGNTSLEGHLIDYDTVFALRGRAPQWTYRPNWLSDFFGLEGPGQKKLLKAIVNQPLNVERISYRELFKEFDQTRQHQLERRFPDLLGFSCDDAAAIPTPMLRRLVEEFQELSLKMFPNFRATAPWEPDNGTVSVYDLSRLFRLLPLKRQNGPLDDESALALIKNPLGRMTASEEPGMPESVRKKLVRDHVVASPEALIELDRRALDFVRDLERQLAVVEERGAEATGAMRQRAYVVNEERTYMNCRPGNDRLVALVQQRAAGNISDQRFSELLHLLVAACDRIPRPDHKGRCQADTRLFLDGAVSHLIDALGGWQPRLTLFDGLSNAMIEVEVHGKRFPCRLESENESMGPFQHFTGPVFPLIHLTEGLPRLRFFINDVPFRPRPILRLDRPPEKLPEELEP